MDLTSKDLGQVMVAYLRNIPSLVQLNSPLPEILSELNGDDKLTCQG